MLNLDGAKLLLCMSQIKLPERWEIDGCHFFEERRWYLERWEVLQQRFVDGGYPFVLVIHAAIESDQLRTHASNKRAHRIVLASVAGMCIRAHKVL